jgi:NADH:ubiquinone oxidoreductase subunit E
MTDVAARHRIEICLGSSCFAKGAGRLAEVASAWAERHQAAIELVGHRCRERCADGPRVVLDGVERRVKDERELAGLLAGLGGP